jgi:hypothetical protein
MAGIVAGIGLALSAVGTGMSFGQATKARRAQIKAEREQKALMAKAKEKAEKNYYETLNVPIDAFDEQYKQNQAAAAQALQVLQEGDSRNLAAGIGGLQSATTKANEATRIGMQDALYENRKMKAEGAEKINQTLIDMEIGAAADQAQMARDYQRDYNAGIQGGITGVGSMASSASSLVPLFGQSKSDRAAVAAENVLGGGSNNQLTEAQAKALGGEAYSQIKNPDYDPDVKGSEEFLQKLTGGTGMTQQARLNRLASLNFTPKEIRKIGRSKNKLADFKTLLQEDRFKDINSDLGSITDMSQLQKLLYGY